MPVRTWGSAVAAALIVAVAFAGCGSTPTRAPSAAPSTPVPSGPAPTGGNTTAFDVCGLLNAGDLERAFGQPMKVAQSFPPGVWAAGSCTWEGTDAETPASLNVMVGTGPSMSGAGIKDPAAWIKDTAAAAAGIYGGTAKPVLGVGDQAYRAGKETAGQLVFCRGSTCALVVVIGLGGDAMVALGKVLANGL